MVPVLALLAWLLVPYKPFGYDGWRTVVLLGSIGAILVWWIRRPLPELPRWLARHGRFAEAEQVTAAIEQQVTTEVGTLPAPGPELPSEEGEGTFAEIWREPYATRAIMLSVFNFFQTFGYYGFAAWVPTLLISKGITVTTRQGSHQWNPAARPCASRRIRTVCTARAATPTAREPGP